MSPKISGQSFVANSDHYEDLDDDESEDDDHQDDDQRSLTGSLNVNRDDNNNIEGNIDNIKSCGDYEKAERQNGHHKPEIDRPKIAYVNIGHRLRPLVEGQQTFEEDDYRQNLATGSPTPLAPIGEEYDDAEKVRILRGLLKLERQKSERQRDQMETVQSYLRSLQADYLRSQAEQVTTLELGHRIKAQKEAEIEAISSELSERERLIAQLRRTASRAELKLELDETLASERRLHETELDVARQQVMSLKKLLADQKAATSREIEMLEGRFEREISAGVAERERLLNRVGELERQLAKLMEEPAYVLVREANEQKGQLQLRLAELEGSLVEAEGRWRAAGSRLESTLQEQADLELASRKEFERLELALIDQRKIIGHLRGQLDDKDELLNISQLELGRQQRRFEALMASLEGKEAAFRGLIEQLAARHEHQLELASGRLAGLDNRLLELEAELGRKRNELAKLRLEHENRFQLMTDEGDQRYRKLSLEREKFQREAQTSELRVGELEAHLAESKASAETLRAESRHLRDEAKRLAVEAAQADARLQAFDREAGRQTELRVTEAKVELQQVRQQLEFDLDESQRRATRQEKLIQELRKDNEKLRMKLRVAETNLARLSSALYSRDNQISKLTDSNSLAGSNDTLDESKTTTSSIPESHIAKYRRYGAKLRKYCEHLTLVHQHMCNPTVCGYFIRNNSIFAPISAEKPHNP